MAAQAGNVDEFSAIVSHPAFNPVGARPHFFAEVGRLSDGVGDANFAHMKLLLEACRVRFH
ncbi:hypothetical protein [Caballeronia sp. BR00000012568055]|uniref:hypothetical protein n=1 Tax=Caballeronia sp. BR00000012568055 TaxID=2918761 RepID=UPI0023F9F575|nr:hypothetical protein [Caballeronia sp. BR00000012568055]